MRNASLFGRLGAVLLLIFCLAGLSGPSQAGIAPPSLPKVLLLHAVSLPAYPQDVEAKLEATGSFSSVDAFDGRFSNPTLAQLQGYDAVLAWTDAPFQDPVAVGNVLADYMDGGGGVVLAAFAFNSDTTGGIEGRIVTAGYLPFVPGSIQALTPLTLVKNLASHPILQGVNSFSGGSGSFHQTVTLAPGSTLVASWSNGRPLVAAKKPTAGKIAGLNFYPASSDVPGRGDFWTSSTDGARLMANSLLWSLSPPPPFISSIQVSDVRTDRATVSWLTDVPVRNSSVEYGLTTAYGSSAASADGTGGIATLTGLQVGKTYHFRVRSTTQAGLGETAISEDLTFVTAPPGTQTVGVFVVRSGGQIVVYATLNNNSAAPLNNLRITRASLRGILSTANTSTAPLPSLGNVPPGGTATTRLAFPAGVGDPGSPLTLSIGWGSSAGSGSGSFRLVYPGEPEPDA